MSDPVHEDDKPQNGHFVDDQQLVHSGHLRQFKSPKGQTGENIAHQAFLACSPSQKEAKQSCCPKWRLYNR